VLPDGRVAFASDRIIADRGFVDAARDGTAPETRFRFSAPCAKHACKQWANERCGVIDTVLEHVRFGDQARTLPDCSIRPQCRWYHQCGAAACAACPLVVTDASASVEGSP
jgi:hypothetical protein